VQAKPLSTSLIDEGSHSIQYNGLLSMGEQSSGHQMQVISEQAKLLSPDAVSVLSKMVAKHFKKYSGQMRSRYIADGTYIKELARLVEAAAVLAKTPGPDLAANVHTLPTAAVPKTGEGDAHECVKSSPSPSFEVGDIVITSARVEKNKFDKKKGRIAHVQGVSRIFVQLLEGPAADTKPQPFAFNMVSKLDAPTQKSACEAPVPAAGSKRALEAGVIDPEGAKFAKLTTSAESLVDYRGRSGRWFEL
jgi:hypothetical protein